MELPLNRTLLELKVILIFKSTAPNTALNRTLLELKDRLITFTTSLQRPLNRTLLELKETYPEDPDQDIETS